MSNQLAALGYNYCIRFVTLIKDMFDHETFLPYIIAYIVRLHITAAD